MYKTAVYTLVKGVNTHQHSKYQKI